MNRGSAVEARTTKDVGTAQGYTLGWRGPMPFLRFFFRSVVLCQLRGDMSSVCVARRLCFLRACAVQNRRRRTLDSGSSPWVGCYCSRLRYTIVPSYVQACIAERVAGGRLVPVFLFCDTEFPTAAGPGESCLLGALSLSAVRIAPGATNTPGVSAASKNRKNAGVFRWFQ